MAMRKLIQDGVDKFGSVSEFHKVLIRAGLDISLSTVRALVKVDQRGEATRKLISTCNEVIYDGDWKKTGKALDQE